MNCNKRAISTRKLVYIFIIICLLPLTACMSKEERKIARDNERLAKPIVQEYLELNYGSGEIISLDSRCHSSTLNTPAQWALPTFRYPLLSFFPP
ncbi:MAG: hypothetical protein QM644_21395, partial [Mobilitalea sp.]